MTGQHVTLAFRKPDEAIYVVSDAGDQWALLMPLTPNVPDTKPANAKEHDQEVA
jgi:hypothetical protein